MASSTPKILILDTLRGICAFIVALYHFLHFENQHGALVEPGNKVLSAVDPFIHGSICIFFIISSYVMYLHLERNDYSLKLFLPFLGKRIVRLMIPMLACVALILAINASFQWYLGEPIAFSFPQLLANITLTANLVGEDWYNPIFWTLSVEFQFYILLGLGFLLIRKNPFIALLLLVGVCIGINYFYDTRGSITEFGSYFIIGIALALFHAKQFSATQLLLIIVLGSIDFFLNQALFYYVIPLVSIPIILFVNFQSKFLQFLGETSYSFYLIHGLLGNWFLYFTLRYMDQTWQKILLLIGAFIVAYLGSHIFYLLIEKPSLKVVKQIHYKRNKLN